MFYVKGFIVENGMVDGVDVDYMVFNIEDESVWIRWVLLYSKNIYL